MLCLDSDIIIDHLRNVGHAAKFLSRVNTGMVTTAINAEEVLWGAVLYKSRKKQEAAKRLLAQLTVIHYDIKAVHQTNEVRKLLRKKETPIGVSDERIAGICIANNLTLVTRNKKHFSKVKGLKVKSW